MKELTLIRTNDDGTMKYRDARGYVRYLNEWGQPISMAKYYLRPLFKMVVFAAVYLAIGAPIMYAFAWVVQHAR